MTPRLFFNILSVEARVRMSYRADFWINAVVGVLAEMGIAYFICTALFLGSGDAVHGGYSRDEMLLYYVAVILIGRIVRSTEFEGVVSTDIYEGGLNRYLVFPATYFPFKFAQHLGALIPLFLQMVVFGGAVALLFDLPPGVQPGWGTVAMTLVSLFFAGLLYFLMVYPIHAIAFWADNVWSLQVAHRLVSMFLGGAMLPLTLFPNWAQDVLLYLPFRYFYGWPTETLLGRMSFGDWAAGLGGAAVWCVVFGLIGRAVFRRGLLQYSGIGI